MELVEEAKKYHLDIVGVSSTKRRGCGIGDLNGRWKLFYSGVDPSMSAQVGVGILTSLDIDSLLLRTETSQLRWFGKQNVSLTTS